MLFFVVLHLEFFFYFKKQERKKRRKNHFSLELRLREEHVPLDLGVVFDERELPRERPRVFPLDVEEARPGRGQQLDEESCSLFRAGHFFGSR